MNIIELARKAGLCLANDEKPLIQTFANAVIKAHEAKLLEGVEKRIAELEELCDSTYVASGADAYHHACSEMERWQKQRLQAGKEVGTQGSLCNGMAWLYGHIATLESTLKVALEALEAIVPCIEVHGDQYKPGNMWHTLSDKGTDAIEQAKEVLHVKR